MPAMSGLAWIIDLEVLAARPTSPATCSGSRVMPGALALMYSLKPSQRCLPVCEVWSWQIRPILPLPPTSSIMCLAASAAAALLSVWTVDSGMSESTPESKATTGMFAALIFPSRSAAAPESRAAKPMAAGLESRAVWSWLSCSVTACSFSGPTNSTL